MIMRMMVRLPDMERYMGSGYIFMDRILRIWEVPLGIATVCRSLRS